MAAEAQAAEASAALQRVQAALQSVMQPLVGVGHVAVAASGAGAAIGISPRHAGAAATPAPALRSSQLAHGAGGRVGDGGGGVDGGGSSSMKSEPTEGAAVAGHKRGRSSSPENGRAHAVAAAVVAAAPGGDDDDDVTGSPSKRARTAAGMPAAAAGGAGASAVVAVALSAAASERGSSGDSDSSGPDDAAASPPPRTRSAAAAAAVVESALRPRVLHHQAPHPLLLATGTERPVAVLVRWPPTDFANTEELPRPDATWLPSAHDFVVPLFATSATEWIVIARDGSDTGSGERFKPHTGMTSTRVSRSHASISTHRLAAGSGLAVIKSVRRLAGVRRLPAQSHNASPTRPRRRLSTLCR